MYMKKINEVVSNQTHLVYDSSRVFEKKIIVSMKLTSMW